MKLRQRLLIVAGLLMLGSFAGVPKSEAQIWANYDVQIANKFYNPLAGATLLSADGFTNFSGGIDHDDGVFNNVPAGFTFDFNGNSYSSVNVCVNGWVSVGPRNTPVITQNNTHLFLPNDPNNTIAPFWGDHFYRTLEPGFRPSRIQYTTIALPDPNPNALPGSFLHEFVVEWRDLNINIDKAPFRTEPNSIASFQVRFIENPMANDMAVPDRRVTVEFHYGSIGNTGIVYTQGATVGMEDSLGFTHMNGMYVSSVASEDSVRLNTTKTTDCWPPATCLPGRVIQFVPEGRASLNQWGDGDVTLDQIFNPNATIRNNQNRFVTLEDADSILRSRTHTAPAFAALDSTEGRQAFHGDANHNGRYTNPNFPGVFFYRVTSYDAAYILLYLAAKLPVLPWPDPLPVPAYKNNGSNASDISGVIADAANARVNGNTVLVPVVLHGSVNGALSIEMNVKSLNTGALQFVGTRTLPNSGTMMSSNAAQGFVVLATAGTFNDGDVIGYLEFNIVGRTNAAIELSNVTVNDEVTAGSSSEIRLAAAGVGTSVKGFSVEQNVPNPFNMSAAQTTSIRFTMGVPENVSLRVFDMLGHEIRTLAFGEVFTTGQHAIEWDGRDNLGQIVPNGLYYYQITSPSFTQTVKMQVVR